MDADEAEIVIDLDDPMTDALNHPAGKLAEAALSRLSKYKPEAGKKLPPQVRPYFDEIADSAHGHFARVMLAARLHYLHAIDPVWAVDKLVPYMSPRQSKEAKKPLVRLQLVANDRPEPARGAQGAVSGGAAGRRDQRAHR